MFRHAANARIYEHENGLRLHRGAIRLFSSMTILAAWQQLTFAR